MLFWFHIMNLLPQNLQNGTASLSAALSETFGIAIAFVCGGQGDTSHPNAFQGHSAVYECGNMLSDHTGQSIGNNTYALEVSPSAAIWTVIFSTHASVFLRHSSLILSSPKIPAKGITAGSSQ